ncbi:hypothetical protein OSTOST_08047 [Ostertagia ostertagi]
MLLRDTQDYCTDSECLTDGGPTAIASNSILLWTMLWGFLALVLFFMRPNSMRGNSNRNEKPGPSNDRAFALRCFQRTVLTSSLGMGDDPCECLFNHEAAMRRLLSLLRDTQDYCTDSECLTDGGPTAIASNSILLWTMLWGFLALVLFFMRPNSCAPRIRMNNQPPPPAIM